MHYVFQFEDVFAAWQLLVKGTLSTIELSMLAMVFGLIVAVFGAWGKTAGPRPLRWLINGYIELIRNTPFLVQLFFFFFALPSLGLRWSAHTAALTAMVVHLGAYATEIIRAPSGTIARIAGSTSPSCTTSEAALSSRAARKVKRSGSPGPAPTRKTVPILMGA